MSESTPASESATGGNIVQTGVPDSATHLQIDPTAATEGEEVFGEGGGDSAIESSRQSSCSTSITSSIKNYVYENGRRYHAYRKGEYMLPNDDEEQARLDLQHHIARLIINGHLCSSPISNPQNVLDMGTGTGIWAIDFADEYPSAQVLGIDLSPIQPQWVPPNCKFLVDDLESDWVLDRQFDLIQGRALGGSIRDWPKLYRQAYENLKPGGWIEVQEYEGFIFSYDDPELKKSPYILEWQTRLDEATASVGKRLAVARKQKKFLQEAGFVNVEDKIFEVPIGRWAQHPEVKELGWFQLAHMIDSVEPYTLGPFTRVLGWSLEETQVLIARVKNELRHKGNHLYLEAHFIHGRKVQD